MADAHTEACFALRQEVPAAIDAQIGTLLAVRTAAPGSCVILRLLRRRASASSPGWLGPA